MAKPRATSKYRSIHELSDIETYLGLSTTEWEAFEASTDDHIRALEAQQVRDIRKINRHEATTV